MDAEDELVIAAGCLSMIADRLSRLGCCCDHNRDATPPMMYDDWISCAVVHARIEGMRQAAKIVTAKAADEPNGSYAHDHLNQAVEAIEAEIKKASE